MAKCFGARVNRSNEAVIGRNYLPIFFVRKNKTIDFFESSPYNKKQQDSTIHFTKVMMRT